MVEYLLKIKNEKGVYYLKNITYKGLKELSKEMARKFGTLDISNSARKKFIDYLTKIKEKIDKKSVFSEKEFLGFKRLYSLVSEVSKDSGGGGMRSSNLQELIDSLPVPPKSTIEDLLDLPNPPGFNSKTCYLEPKIPKKY